MLYDHGDEQREKKCGQRHTRIKERLLLLVLVVVKLTMGGQQVELQVMDPPPAETKNKHGQV